MEGNGSKGLWIGKLRSDPERPCTQHVSKAVALSPDPWAALVPHWAHLQTPDQSTLGHLQGASCEAIMSSMSFQVRLMLVWDGNQDGGEGMEGEGAFGKGCPWQTVPLQSVFHDVTSPQSLGPLTSRL